MMKFRSTLLDRAGNATDNGYMQVYGSMMRKYFPTAFKNEMLEAVAETGTDGFQFARPMQLSELFDRVQTLPECTRTPKANDEPVDAGKSRVCIWHCSKRKANKALTSKGQAHGHHHLRR
jgi:hypothetical protein